MTILHLNEKCVCHVNHSRLEQDIDYASQRVSSLPTTDHGIVGYHALLAKELHGLWVVFNTTISYNLLELKVHRALRSWHFTICSNYVLFPPLSTGIRYTMSVSTMPHDMNLHLTLELSTLCLLFLLLASLLEFVSSLVISLAQTMIGFLSGILVITIQYAGKSRGSCSQPPLSHWEQI